MANLLSCPCHLHVISVGYNKGRWGKITKVLEENISSTSKILGYTLV